MIISRTVKLREMMLCVSHDKYRVRKDLTILGQGFDEDCVMLRKARALELLIREMPVFIQENEFIVGGRTMFMPRCEYGDGYWQDGAKRNLDFSPDAETLAVKSPGFEFYPHYAKPEEIALGKPYEIGEGYVTSHCAAGYRNMLENGIGGIRLKAEKALKEGGRPQEEKDFLTAVTICMDSASLLAIRYAEEAQRLATMEKEMGRRGELNRIEQTCRRISTAVPENLHEAIQLLFFIHTIILIENYNLMSLGRMDQYLYPFYKKAVIDGKLGVDEARELFECLFIKLNDTSDLHTDNGLNIIVGGLKPDGEDGTNELTYLLLDVHRTLGLTDPQINVRLHGGSSRKLFDAAFLNESIGAKPMIYNDEALIAALVKAGVGLEDARDYCIDACQDVLIGGKSDFYPIFAGIYGCHLLTILERVVDRLESYGSFDLFKAALDAEIKADIKNYAGKANAADAILPLLSPTPFLSSTLEECVERGKDKTRGGTKYNFTGFVGGGIVNVADSIAAIKTLVFERNRVDAGELVKALNNNFQGFDSLRTRLKNEAPKWGNNDNAVDLICVEIAHLFCQEVLKYTNPRGGSFLPGFFTHHQARLGKKLRATADGRRQGEALAISLSPTHGAERKGPTGAILSAVKIDSSLCPLGTSLDLTFQPSLFRPGDEGEKFRFLVNTFLNKGGIELQVNSLDAGILREAQENPEQYRDLVVRVWGFNAYFVSLKPEYQEEVINRIEAH
jgi:pyruvate-formate lyase